MNYLNNKQITNYNDLLVVQHGKFNVVFSTAEDNRDFSMHTEEGVANLEKLKKEFDVDEVVHLRQIHSDEVHIYNDENKDLKNKEGDAIVTNKTNTIIGVFTADCVPIILLDENKKAVAAIHSGWKGTFKSITKKTIEKMIKEFNVNPGDLKAYIGPHIRKCCYEVSNDLKDEFLGRFNLPKDKLFNDKHLNLELCIENDLISAGVNSNNIFAMPFCTYCENGIKLHSYRRSNGSYGRLFSFAFIKNEEE